MWCADLFRFRFVMLMHAYGSCSITRGVIEVCVRSLEMEKGGLDCLLRGKGGCIYGLGSDGGKGEWVGG